MLLSSLLLMLLCGLAVQSQTWHYGWTVTPASTPQNLVSTQEAHLSSLQLYAKTDPSVLVGLRVVMTCSAFLTPPSVLWSWQRLEGHSWQEVGGGLNLSLSRPDQSGVYRCHARSASQSRVSNEQEVVILASHPTVSEKLGVAAFVISLLALIINVAILVLLGFLRLSSTLTITGAGAKAFPEPVKAPKGGLPATNSDADVYMNYTSTKQAYSDLDPAQMAGDSVYASLS